MLLDHLKNSLYRNIMDILVLFNFEIKFIFTISISIRINSSFIDSQ